MGTFAKIDQVVAWSARTNCGLGNAGNGVRGYHNTAHSNLEQLTPGYFRQERRGDSGPENLLSEVITPTKGNECPKKEIDEPQLNFPG